MTREPSPSPEASWIALLCMDRDVLGWAASIASFSAACDRVVVTVAAEYRAEARAAVANHDNVDVVTLTLSDALTNLIDQAQAFVVVREPALVAPDAFGPARAMVADDLRIATVSFFSNDADYLSIPHRNHPQLLVPSGQTEGTVTEALRSEALLRGPVPLPVPAGVVVAVTNTALRSVGRIVPTAPTSEFGLVEFGLRASTRAMRNVLDPTTYVLRAAGRHRQVELLLDANHRAFLSAQYPFFPAGYDLTRDSDQEPVAPALTLARVVMEGLTVLVDGSMIGPFETGTQVQLLNLVSALGRHPGVKTVHIGIPGPVPNYAAPHLLDPGISVVRTAGGDFEMSERVDILHRPGQPDGTIPWERWRQLAQRTVITVQDLIAYANGSYFADAPGWLRYRDDFRRALANVDGVLAISRDTADAIRDERMPVAPEAVRVVPNGADHEQGTDDDARPPEDFYRLGLVNSSFLFVLGTSYAHKNRDLAIHAWRELRQRGIQEKLVMAGVVVPYGSTRNEETRAFLALPPELRSDVVILPDVGAPERRWLLRHASLVLYPTSAEGFGLVPFEAAQFSTPTVFIPFGPLSEILPSVPVGAKEWSADSLADAAEKLLRDPALSRQQVDATRIAAKGFTWESNADQAVAFYREVLSRPARTL